VSSLPAITGVRLSDCESVRIETATNHFGFCFAFLSSVPTRAK